MGPATQLVVAIIVTYLTAGAASGAIAAAGAGTSVAGATAAATTATAATATSAATAATAAGWANVAGSAIAASTASTGAISTINNRGNLGAVVDDVTSSDATRGYAVAGITAGLTAGYFNDWTGTQTGASGALQNSGHVTVNGGLSSLGGAGSFATNQALQNGTSLLVDRALGGNSKFSDALQSTLANSFTAVGFNLVGDISSENNLDLDNGSLAKVGLHALMGGLAAEAAGGDFKTGALAAGVNEALVDSLAQQYGDMNPDEKKSLLVMNSQLIGMLAAATLPDADGESLQTGAWVAGNATQYNRLLHDYEKKSLANEADTLLKERGPSESGASWDDLLLLRSGAELDAQENARLQSLLKSFTGGPEQESISRDLQIAGASIDALASQNTLLTYADGTPITANGEKVYAFQVTPEQFNDHDLFNTSSSGSLFNGGPNWEGKAPQSWQDKFGSENANRYLAELAKGASSQAEFDDLVMRMTALAKGGINDVTWDVDAALALAGAGSAGVKVLTEVMAKRAALKAAGAKGSAAKSPSSIGAIADNETAGFSYYDQFKKADGEWQWPKNLGFAEDPVKNTLPVGTKLDRYGGPDGSFLSPKGTPFDQRALAPGSKAGGYYEYEVLKPLPVIQGKIAPAFNEPGGGMQILPALSERVNVQWLIDNHFIKEVR